MGWRHFNFQSFMMPLTRIALVQVISLVGFVIPGLAADKVRASRGEMTLPTYPWAAVKHPYFRGTDKLNIYPYPMLDFLSREKSNRAYKTVVLENEYLRVTFLPELGGKIQDVTDKVTGQPMFYVNHVVKPGLIAQCGAWTSGGVEWNTGPQGHTVSAMQPVPVEILPPAKDGSQSVAIGETERIYGTRWTVIVTLRPGRSFIEERIRIYNPTETIRPYYFWNCTAMPNTPGFRFIYPMTLGCDHGSEKFFQWPIDNGKDLTRGTNYYDASSIFAWHCDQDFFGSYDDDADRGVVSHANHHQVPGKKAWTWGQGGFGRMHQMDLTDNDGPYNEVQTGPLLTQGEVGRLDPCEAVTWDEFWYPIHGIGGFTYANKDVAVNAAREGSSLSLRVLGTGTWNDAIANITVAGDPKGPSATLRISPEHPLMLRVPLGVNAQRDAPVSVSIRSKGQLLASFDVPLNLPERKRPEKKPEPQTAAEIAERGWQDFLFARFPEAEAQFRKALQKDPKLPAAHTGLAFLRLDADLEKAAISAAEALDTRPDYGLARFALAVAQSRSGRHEALDNAWQASLDPVTAAAGRALAAKLLLSQARYSEAVQALSGPGPWENDLVCRERLALALQLLGRKTEAAAAAREALDIEPLDAFSRTILWLGRAEPKGLELAALLRSSPTTLNDLFADFSDLNQSHIMSGMAKEFGGSRASANAFCGYWVARSLALTDKPADEALRTACTTVGSDFPYRYEMIPVLQWALQKNPKDGKAALWLGDLLFHFGRQAEGREMWQKAADLGAEPVLAYRALGMASLNLDKDPQRAASFLQKAHDLDSRDAIVARDLARVLFDQAEKLEDKEQKREMLSRARDTLKTAFDSGRIRSDYVGLLARAQNRLGEYEPTARMLDSVRVTVWEGSHEVHDLFEEAHVELGKASMSAGKAAEALREFDRALEYPQNLATGKLENAREAHIQYLRGNALSELGKTDEAIRAWKLAAAETKSSDAQKEEARAKAREALERAGVKL